MPPLLTAIGEILVDFTPVVEAGRTVGFRMHPGGSPFNVAVGLARLGGRVEFAGKASTDSFGGFLVAHLEREGIGTRFLSRSPAPSTLAFVTIADGDPTYAFYGEGAADTRLRPEDLPAEIEASDVLHFGSVSLLREPAASTIANLVERLAGRTLLSFDPNIRPHLIDDPDTYRRVAWRLLRMADIVRASAADVRWLLPKDTLESAADRILAEGPPLVVVTRGAEGSYARFASGSLRVPAPAVTVVDTIGAGDAFTAALLSRLVEGGVTSRADLMAVDGAALNEALRFASLAAAFTCTRTGADPPRREEIEHTR
ncbi:MAG: carbohydrate kinase family protein [Armatimonadota bacterium]